MTPTTVTDLTLEEKCILLGGASSWRTHPVERVGVPALRMSDGPNGVRGEAVGATRTPGVCVPVGIALGATWNPDLLREIGELLGVEAQRKGAHVLLAPTVNLQRTPVGGRVFECYSEDPELTARLAVEMIRGVQSRDVAVTVKHFVANDTEVDRHVVDARVPERALRELYLRPFEAAVTEAGAWGVMSAYNQVSGEFCAANRMLLTTILREEWGFDGFVVSDWFGSHDTVLSARAGLTVAMPGPNTIYGDKLAAAVKAGDVEAGEVDALVNDLLRVIDRTRAAELPATRPEETVDDPNERSLCRRAANEGIVLLRNEGAALPLATSARVAIIGPNARASRIMGGGSAGLEPLPHQSILAALTERLTKPPLFEQGVRIDNVPPVLTSTHLTTSSGDRGLHVEYRNGPDFDSEVVASDISPTSIIRLFGSTPEGVDATSFSVTATGTFTPETDGPFEFSAAITGAGQVTAGPVTVLDDPDRQLPRSSLFFGTGSITQTAVVEGKAGQPIPVTIASTGRNGFCGVRLGAHPVDPGDMLDRALEAAAAADVSVVVVGTNDEWETEGHDRDTISLPGDQNDLIARVAAVSKRTVVVVNAGSPVAMPWLDDVDAVVVAYFGGQEMGPAVADVLVGATDPGGRLPITYPRLLEDTPAWPHYAPVDGVQTYGEGILMGYRGFDAASTTPLFPFGHGLSYGTSSWAPARVDDRDLQNDLNLTVEVDVTNTGERPVTDVVQIYLSKPDSAVERAPKELIGFAKVMTDPGDTTTATVRLGSRAFRHWDDRAHEWRVEGGTYDLLIARSSRDVVETVTITVKPASS